MTECIGSPAHELAEQYLAGTLPEDEVRRFEDHYFACDECHEQLIALQEIRDALSQAPVTVAVGNAPKRKRGIGALILAFPARSAMLGSVAALLIAAAVLFGIQKSTHLWTSKSRPGNSVASGPSVPPGGGKAPGATAADSQPSSSAASTAAISKAEDASSLHGTELAELADLHFPAYQQSQLRGEAPADDTALSFTAGMQAYAREDCAGAIENLAKVPATSEDGIAAGLYSGLCQLKQRELDQAQASFSRVVAGGDTPQLEAAEYFLAQTRLLRGDAAGATRWLDKTIALHGDYEDRAQKQIALLTHEKQTGR